MKKLIAAILMLVLIPSTFAVSASAETTITFYDIASSTSRMNYFESVFADFYAETGIKVIYEGEAWSNSMGNLTTMCAAGNAPDVYVSMQYQTIFVENGWQLPLDEYIEAHKDEYTALAVHYFWELEKKTYGHNYVIPDGFLVKGVYYRKDWVEEIGYQIPTGKDWTWEEFWKLAEALTDPEKNRYGFSFRGGAGASDWAHNFVNGYTGSYRFDPETMQFLKEDFSAGMKAYTDSWLNGLSPRDSLNWGWSEQIDAFTGGLVGLFFNDTDVAPYCFERMEDGTWGVLPVPYSAKYGTFASSSNSTYCYAVNAASPHTEEAVQLLAFMMDGTRNAEYCIMMGEVPSVKSAAENEYFSEEGPLGEFIKEVNNIDMVLGGQATGINLSAYAESNYDMAAEMQDYLMGNKEFDAWMDEYAAWYQDALDKAYAENPDMQTDIFKLSDFAK
ncbi:MAG: extracellular solute-binding protein [Christensenellales bacterium]|jgi:multiple sugar transport system substrate-binding protein